MAAARGIAAAYVPPRAEALFVLDKVTRWEKLFAPDAHTDIATAHSVLTAGARFAADTLAPTNAVGDAQGGRLINGRVHLSKEIGEALAQEVANGWPGFDLPLEHGGQELPRVAQVAFAEMVNGANVAFGMLPIMLRTAAWRLLEHGTPDLIARVVPPLVRGGWSARSAFPKRKPDPRWAASRRSPPRLRATPMRSPERKRGSAMAIMI